MKCGPGKPVLSPHLRAGNTGAKAREALLYRSIKRRVSKSVTHETSHSTTGPEKKKKSPLTLENHRHDRIWFPKFRFRDIAGRFHYHPKHGSSWAESKFQRTELSRVCAGAPGAPLCRGRRTGWRRREGGEKADLSSSPVPSAGGKASGWISDGWCTEH